MQVLVSSPWRCLEPPRLEELVMGSRAAGMSEHWISMDVCKLREPCRKGFGEETQHNLLTPTEKILLQFSVKELLLLKMSCSIHLMLPLPM